MSDNISPSKVAASNKKNSGKKHGGLLKFIVLHPAIAFVIVVSTLAIAIALIAFLLYSANVQMDTILKMYTSLTARVQDSKSEFNKKKYYITVDEQGITHITVRLDTGFDTEYDEYGNPIEGDEDEDNRDDNDNIGGDTYKDPDPVNGDTLDFPPIGDTLWYRVINTDVEGRATRKGPDKVTWEFAFNYISTTTNSKFTTMKKRANKIGPYVTNGSTNDALKVKLGSEEYYVGCLPIAGFGGLGDIVEFTFDNGNSIKVLAIDAKSDHDATGTGAVNQCNTKYCHGIINSSDNTIQLSAIELWCAGDRTSNGKVSTLPSGNVVKAKIVGHSDVFN